MNKKQQEEVGKFTEEYLKNRKQISLIIFLLDIRHNPSINDKLLYEYIINSNIPCIIVANKSDKIAKTKVNEKVIEIQNVLNPLKDLTFLPFSSENRIYNELIWEHIEKHI